MEIKEIIEKSIEGGWKPRGFSIGKEHEDWKSLENVITLVPIHEILLDPKFWKAIYPEDVWTAECEISLEQKKRYGVEYMWQHKMHQMTNALIDGLSIEDYIKTL